MSRIALVTILGALFYLATPTSAVLSDEEKEELIRAHNFYRGKVQPTATDMLAMVSEHVRIKLANFKEICCHQEVINFQHAHCHSI